MYEVRKEDGKFEENVLMESLYSFGLDGTNYFVILLV